MKDQINRFARGVFEYNSPVLEVLEKDINETVDKNREFNGAISFVEKEGGNLKGIIYSDNDRIVLKDNTFSGSRGTIRYTVNSKDTPIGGVVKGAFHIVSNGGEKAVNFSFRVESGSFDTTVGSIRELSQFTALAKEDYMEAISVMKDETFADVILADNIKLQTLYRSIEKGRDSRNSLEEFLIAAGEKERINISIAVDNRCFEHVKESFKETVLIERDTWGYSNVSVKCDSPFIKLERREIASDLFAANKYEFAYIVDFERLHYGKNYAVIYFETINASIPFNITVIKGETATGADNRRKIRKLNYDFMSLYVKFRTHSVNMPDWIIKSKNIIEEIRAINDENDAFYRLALAQIHITEKLDTQAKWLIDTVKDEIDTEDISSYPLYCYFIYVNTLYNKDRNYSRKASSIVKECYRKNPDWRILWTLLFMDEEFEHNPSLKLLRIKEQFNKGCTSPALYIEACNILNEQPALLRVLNTFEINVLCFGMKHNIINHRLCGHVAQMVTDIKSGSGKFLRLMMQMYEYYSDGAILEGLCKILIRNHCVGSRYIEYYELGIKAEFKITRLFEFYIESRRPDDMSPLPKIVLMYFSYNNSLESTYKAYLYANVINNKTNNPQVYNSYMPQINSFGKEQMSLGRINEHLALIYKTITDIDFIAEDNAVCTSEMFMSYRIECRDGLFNKVIISYKEGNFEKEYPVTKGVSYVSIYTQDATVIFENEDSDRFYFPYSITSLLQDDLIVQKCAKFNSGILALKLISCDKLVRARTNQETVSRMLDIMKTEQINLFYRRKFVSQIIEFFHDGYDFDGFMDFLSQIDMKMVQDDDIVKLIEIFIVHGNYKKAFELIRKYSYAKVNTKRLMKLCSKLILSEEQQESDFLMSMCNHVFQNGKYDETILEYLVDGFYGSGCDMINIWKCAVESDIDTYELEERIVVQIMFTNSYEDILADIFDNYFSRGANERIVEAYLAYNAYRYFVREKEISESVFDIMETYFENEKDLAPICKMALTKYYSGLLELSEYRKCLGMQLIAQLVRKEYVFPFYLELADKIPVPSKIADKTMVEYRTNPKNRVVIHYTYEDRNHKKKYITEDMKNVYDGIFVKQFVLFCGESIKYYITEEENDSVKATQPEILVNKWIKNENIISEKSQGRYEMLNDIIDSRKEHDNPTFGRLMHTYAVTEYVTEQIFKPL